MDIKINTLQKDRPVVPLLVGQVRMSESKEQIILITRDNRNQFGVVYLKDLPHEERKESYVSLVPMIHKVFERDYPIVADSTSLLINIK